MKVPCKMEEANFAYTLSIIGGKWKMMILYQLAGWKVLRYNELKRNIPGITYKMLSAQLKELEGDGIVHRKEYPQVPPKVEYSLTDRGSSLIPLLNEICKWGNEHCHYNLN